MGGLCCSVNFYHALKKLSTADTEQNYRAAASSTGQGVQEQGSLSVADCDARVASVGVANSVEECHPDVRLRVIDVGGHSGPITGLMLAEMSKDGLGSEQAGAGNLLTALVREAVEC